MNLLNELAFSVNQYLSQLGSWQADLANILCKPVSLINHYIGNVEAKIPGGLCQISRVELGEDLEAALNALLVLSTAKSLTVQGANRDLLRYGLLVSGAADRLQQFRGGSACNDENTSNFVNAAELNLQGTINPDPTRTTTLTVPEGPVALPNLAPSGGGFF